MKHTLLRWIASVVLVVSCLLPAAHAQRGKSDEVSRGVRPGDEVGPGLETHPTAALPYAFAGFILILVMVIVCAPSRKMIRD